MLYLFWSLHTLVLFEDILILFEPVLILLYWRILVSIHGGQMMPFGKWTLVQVMVYCLIATSHYLNHCQQVITAVLWHSPEEDNYTPTQRSWRRYIGFTLSVCLSKHLFLNVFLPICIWYVWFIKWNFFSGLDVKRLNELRVHKPRAMFQDVNSLVLGEKDLNQISDQGISLVSASITAGLVHLLEHHPNFCNLLNRAYFSGDHN